MEKLYRLLWKILFPFLLIRLFLKGEKNPLYRQNWQERLGLRLPFIPPQSIWLHAVSVGEMNAARPFLTLLEKECPYAHFLITMTTPTGRKVAENLGLKNATLCYLPYDEFFCVRRFLRHFQPRIAFFMETEIWPEILKQLKAQSIPAILLNGRMSPQSARGYARFLKLMRPAFSCFSLLLAQSPMDGKRFQFLGAKNIVVAGNFKFDLPPNAEQIEAGECLKKSLPHKFIILAASTRKGEEALILNAFLKSSLREEALLIIAPRHVERVEEISLLAKKMVLTMEKRSQNLPLRGNLWLGDTMGEMPFYYALADAVLMGGTFLNTGGQNFIEAALCKKAIILGASTFNFAFAAKKARLMRAAVFVDNVDSAFSVLERWAKHPQELKEWQHNAQIFGDTFQGATQKTFERVKEFLK